MKNNIQLIRVMLFSALMILLSNNGFAQVTHGGVMEDVVICGTSSAWTVQTTAGGTLVINNLPPGYTFDSFVSSDCGATMTSSSPPTFNIPTPCSLTYRVQAECDAYKARDPAQGGNPNMVFSVDYSWNGTTLAPIAITAETNNPELNVEVVTNGTPVGANTTFTRIVRVCQDGVDAYVDDPIIVNNTFGSGFTVLNITDPSGIPIPYNVTTGELTIAPSFFVGAMDRSQTAGDGDANLDGSDSSLSGSTAECIYIHYELQLECIGTTNQSISSTWGCAGEECALPSTESISGNVDNTKNPVLKRVYPSGINSWSGIRTCFDPTTPWTKKAWIYNEGLGTASNFTVCFNHAKSYEGDLGSSTQFDAIDRNSLVYELSSNPGSSIPLAYDTSFPFPDTRSGYPIGQMPDCVNEFPIPITEMAEKVCFTVDFIPAGDTLEISYDTYTCCPDHCELNQFLGTDGTYLVDGSYQNACETQNFVFTKAEVSSFNQEFLSADGEGISDLFGIEPPSWSDYKQCGEVRFSFHGSFIYKVEDGAYVESTWNMCNRGTHPAYLFPANTTSPDLKLQYVNGTSPVSPISTNWDGCKLTARFDWDDLYTAYGVFNPQIQLEGVEVVMSLCADCPNGNVGATINIEHEMSIVPDPTCTSCNGNTISMDCADHPVVIHCPCELSPALINTKYNMERISIGLPDNDADGCPDSTGVLNHRVDRVFTGDSLYVTYKGFIAGAGASFPNIYHSLGNDPNVAIVTEVGPAELTVYDNSSGTTFSCTIPQGNVVQGEEIWWDFSPAALVSSCPSMAGFTYEEGDTITFNTIMVASECYNDNLGGNIFPGLTPTGRQFPVNLRSDTYASLNGSDPTTVDIADRFGTSSNAGVPFDNYHCDNYGFQFLYISPRLFNHGLTRANGYNCDPILVDEANEFQMGPHPGSFGDDMFPNEYRNFSYIDSIVIWYPPGYKLDRLDINWSYTTGPGKSEFDWLYDAPVEDPNANPWVFRIKDLYDAGLLKKSTDGYYFKPTVYLLPSCEVTPNTFEDVWWYFEVDYNSDALTEYCGDRFMQKNQDKIRYFPPELALSSSNQILNGDCPEVSWPLNIANVANNSNASNVWLYFPPSTVQVNDVTLGGTSVIENNGFYEIGTVNRNSSLDFEIDAEYLTCGADSLIVYMGWDCIGYPTNILDYPCPMDSVVLYVNPTLPEFNLAILQPNGPVTIDLCEEITYEFQYKNVGEAKAYNIFTQTFVPTSGALLVPGSLEIEYPCGTGYKSWSGAYPLPSSFPLGTLFEFDITTQSQINADIDLIGVAPDDGWNYPNISEVSNCFNIRFDIDTECGFDGSGDLVRSLAVGDGPCSLTGDPTNKVYAAIENIGTISVNGVNNYSMILNTTVAPTLMACAEQQTLNIDLTMDDPGPTEATDSVKIRLPSGFKYLNDDSGLTPLITNLPNVTVLAYSVDPPLTQNDNMNFTINYLIDGNEVDCEEQWISVSSVTSEQVQCIDNPPLDLCRVFSNTAKTDIPVQITKPDLNVIIKEAITTCSTNDFSVNINVDLINNDLLGIDASQEFYIDILANLDGSCSEFGNNVPVATLTVNGPIAAGATLNLSQTMDVPADACNLIAKIRGCVCGEESTDCIEIDFDPDLAIDYTSCHNEPIQIETCNNPAFTYNWVSVNGSNISYLNDLTIYNPTVTVSNLTGSNIVLEYGVNIDRGIGCRAIDTVKITVYPLQEEVSPIINSLCFGENHILSAPTGTVGSWLPTDFLLNANDPSTVVFTPTNLDPVEYTWTYTDANGCDAYYKESFFVEECIDLAVTKSLVNPSTEINVGDVIQYQIEITNESNFDASNIVIRDSLRSCLQYISNSTSTGSAILAGFDEVIWTIPYLAAGQSASLFLDAQVRSNGPCFNSVEVTGATETDSDSEPDNDDGDQSEDDEDGISFDACTTDVCLPVKVTVKRRGN